MSYSYTTSETFTRTHARHLASKIAADLHQCSLFYGRPSRATVTAYQDELVELLFGGYVAEYEFGFKRNDEPVSGASWSYVVGADGNVVSVTGDAGGLSARATTDDAEYYNFLTYSHTWFDLSADERRRIKDRLPISRSAGSLPRGGTGYWAEAREYGAGGVRITRLEYREA